MQEPAQRRHSIMGGLHQGEDVLHVEVGAEMVGPGWRRTGRNQRRGGNFLDRGTPMFEDRDTKGGGIQESVGRDTTDVADGAAFSVARDLDHGRTAVDADTAMLDEVSLDVGGTAGAAQSGDPLVGLEMCGNRKQGEAAGFGPGAFDRGGVENGFAQHLVAATDAEQGLAEGGVPADCGFKSAAAEKLDIGNRSLGAGDDDHVAEGEVGGIIEVPEFDAAFTLQRFEIGETGNVWQPQNTDAKVRGGHWIAAPGRRQGERVFFWETRILERNDPESRNAGEG